MSVYCTCPWTDLFIHWDRVSVCCHQLYTKGGSAPLSRPWAAWDDLREVLDSPIFSKFQTDMREGTGVCEHMLRCRAKVVRPDVDTSTNTLQPYRATVSVTARCNAQCQYCPFWQGLPFTPLEPSLEQVDRLMTTLNEMGLAELWYTGGDPLFMSDAMLDRYMDTPSKVIVTSNGLGLTEERWARHFATSRHELRMTVDAIDPEIYRKIRGPFGTTPLPDRLRRIFKDQDTSRVEIGCTLNTSNIGEVPKIIELAAELHIPRIWINSVQSDLRTMPLRDRCFDAKYRELEELQSLLDQFGDWAAYAKQLKVHLKNLTPTLKVLERAIEIKQQSLSL